MVLLPGLVIIRLFIHNYEYDSKDFALGATYLLFNHLHAQVELQKMKYFTGGLMFRFCLK